MKIKNNLFFVTSPMLDVQLHCMIEKSIRACLLHSLWKEQEE